MRNPELSLVLADLPDQALLAQLACDYHQIEPVAVSDEAVAASMAALIADRSLGRVWLLTVGGEPVGYAVLAFGFSLAFGGRDGFLDELYLVPEWRGRGIGRAAIEQIRSAASAEGLKAVHLEVARDNDKGRHLYEQMGFEDRRRFSLMSLVLNESGE